MEERKTGFCGELHLGEAGEGNDEEVPGTFMWREGRQVTGGEPLLGETGERVDDKVPGAFMWSEGRQQELHDLFLGSQVLGNSRLLSGDSSLQLPACAGTT